MHSGHNPKDKLLPVPFVIARADFNKLFPVYQLMALALEKTGKVRIVDGVSPSTDAAACQESTELPREAGDHRNPTEPHSTDRAGLAVRPAKGRWRRRRAVAGSASWPNPAGGHQPASLGYYRLIRNGTPVRVAGVAE